jgi:hypothetical protein
MVYKEGKKKKEKKRKREIQGGLSPFCNLTLCPLFARIPFEHSTTILFFEEEQERCVPEGSHPGIGAL